MDWVVLFILESLFSIISVEVKEEKTYFKSQSICNRNNEDKTQQYIVKRIALFILQTLLPFWRRNTYLNLAYLVPYAYLWKIRKFGVKISSSFSFFLSHSYIFPALINGEFGTSTNNSTTSFSIPLFSHFVPVVGT